MSSDSDSEDERRAAAIRSCVVNPSTIGKAAQTPETSKLNARGSDGTTGEKLSHRQLQIGEALQKYLDKELTFSMRSASGDGQDGQRADQAMHSPHSITDDAGGFRFFNKVAPGQPPVLPPGNERMAEGGVWNGTGAASSKMTSGGARVIPSKASQQRKHGHKGWRSNAGGSSDSDASHDSEKEKLLSVVVDAAFITAGAAKAAVAARKHIVAVDDVDGKGRPAPGFDISARGGAATTPLAAASMNAPGSVQVVQTGHEASSPRLSKKTRKAAAELSKKADIVAACGGVSGQLWAVRDDEQNGASHSEHGVGVGHGGGSERATAVTNVSSELDGLTTLRGREECSPEALGEKRKERRKKRKSAGGEREGSGVPSEQPDGESAREQPGVIAQVMLQGKGLFLVK